MEEKQNTEKKTESQQVLQENPELTEPQRPSKIPEKKEDIQRQEGEGSSPKPEDKIEEEDPTKSSTENIKPSENMTATDDNPSKLFVVEEHHDTDEVINRLLDVKGLEQSVSSLWGWMSGSVKTVQESATKVAEKASQVKELATQQANEIAAKVSKAIEDKAPPIEETKISNIPASSPWETAHPERRAEARERVLKLSMDDQTFTVPPPKEANYLYDAAAREPYAARMLDTDALLSAKRFKLVPKIVDEFDFWRNYFYRVDLILNAMGVPSVHSEEKKLETKKFLATEELPEVSNNPDWEEEMRKEIAAAEASHVEDHVKEDENFDMLEDDLEFDEDDPELQKSMNDLNLH